MRAIRSSGCLDDAAVPTEIRTESSSHCATYRKWLHEAVLPGAHMNLPKKDDCAEPANDLFLGTAEYYERHRVPYRQEAFDWIVDDTDSTVAGDCWMVAAVQDR